MASRFVPSATRVAALALLLAGLSACSGIGENDRITTASVQPTTVPGLTLSETGVGLVDQSTSFSARAISEALSGARVETVNATDDGRVVSQLAAFGPSGLQMARFRGAGGRVTSIQVVSEDVPGPGGARVGMSYRQTGGNAMECEEGSGSWTQMAVCQRLGSAITYVYSVPLWTEGRMPRGNELNDAILNRMIWEP
ncbi:MAG: DUF1131 family protein [Devosiaceae bacterium]|nr:DUF1131 family protein [Devosiaceae bacterium MH13]